MTTRNTTFIPDKDRQLLPTHVVTGFPVVQRIVNAPPTYSIEDLAERERQRNEAQLKHQRQLELAKKQQELQQQQDELKARIRAREQQMERELAAQKAAEAEALRKRQQREAEDRAAKLELQRRQALINELTQSLAQDVMETVVNEEVKIAAMSTVYQSRVLKKKMEPYLVSARTRVSRRRHLASERGHLHRLVDRLSKHVSKPSCKAIKQQRIRESLYLEKRMVFEMSKVRKNKGERYPSLYPILLI